MGRKKGWANDHADSSGLGQQGAVPQKPPSASQHHRDDRPSGPNRRPEGAQLKRAYARLRGKRALCKYEEGFAPKQSFLHLLSLAGPRPQLAPLEGKMSQFAEKSANERHIVDLVLGQEVIVRLE